MIESELKSVFIGNSVFQKQVQNILLKDDFYIVPEVQFINGITADFCVFDKDNKINSIIECKGDDIGVTEYVRGIGQIMQYEYFKKHNITGNINKDCKVYLSFPSSLIAGNNSFDVAKFSYPENTELLIVNSENNSPISINPNKEYQKIVRQLDTIQISPYYFRDTRIAELYMILKEIVKSDILNFNKLARQELGLVLKKYNTVNQNNSRNVFIALASLGLINSSNKPTIKGIELSQLDFADFCGTICFEYYKPFINAIFRSFDYIQKKENFYNIKSVENCQIVEIIKNFYLGKDIYFLTESQGRYISSWLSSLRDDLGCIDFLPNKQKKEIIINYNPIYSKENTIKYIRNNVKIPYLENYLKGEISI